MRLQNIMRTDVVTIDAAESADAAWSKMRKHRIRHLVVTDNGRLVGVVSERDLGGPHGAAIRKNQTVQALTTSHLVSAKPTTTLRQAANMMRGRLIGSLPVLDGDRLVGIVTATDVLDELGRGSIRPAVRGERGPLRAPPPNRTQTGSTAVIRRRASAARPTGRARARTPDSAKRAPLARRRSKVSKRGRNSEPSHIPAYIRATGRDLTADDRSYIRRKLGAKLGKFADAIERVSVRTEDVNGPRGGVDQMCRIKVALNGLPSVVFESQDASLQVAVDGAIAGVERTVRRAVQRRRSKPLRQANGSLPARSALALG